MIEIIVKLWLFFLLCIILFHSKSRRIVETHVYTYTQGAVNGGQYLYWCFGIHRSQSIFFAGESFQSDKIAPSVRARERPSRKRNKRVAAQRRRNVLLSLCGKAASGKYVKAFCHEKWNSFFYLVCFFMIHCKKIKNNNHIIVLLKIVNNNLFL